MTKTIKSTEIVKPDAVGAVAPETPAERIFRVFFEIGIRPLGALAIVLAGFVVLLVIIFSDSTHVEHFREEAFASLITMIGGAVGFLFGSQRKDGH